MCSRVRFAGLGFGCLQHVVVNPTVRHDTIRYETRGLSQPSFKPYTKPIGGSSSKEMAFTVVVVLMRIFTEDADNQYNGIHEQQRRHMPYFNE